MLLCGGSAVAAPGARLSLRAGLACLPAPVLSASLASLAMRLAAGVELGRQREMALF